MPLFDCFSHVGLYVKFPPMRFGEIIMYSCSNRNLPMEGESVIMEVNEPSISMQSIMFTCYIVSGETKYMCSLTQVDSLRKHQKNRCLTCGAIIFQVIPVVIYINGTLCVCMFVCSQTRDRFHFSDCLEESLALQFLKMKKPPEELEEEKLSGVVFFFRSLIIL